MNLSKLFDLQKAVDAPYSNVEDRLSKDILWLMEEIGELAREWRGHKYRRPAEEQIPNTRKRIKCPTCEGHGRIFLNDYDYNFCPDCDRKFGGIKTINPLLEEYTDCLSIILSIGLQIGTTPKKSRPFDSSSVEKRFICLMGGIADFFLTTEDQEKLEGYYTVFDAFFGLGQMLGFTWEQIEENYIAKVEANKQRNC